MSVAKLSWKKNAKQQNDGLFISFIVSNSNSSHKAMLAACTTEEERQALLAKWEAERLAEEAEIERLRKLAAEQRSVFFLSASGSSLTCFFQCNSIETAEKTV